MKITDAIVYLMQKLIKKTCYFDVDFQIVEAQYDPVPEGDYSELMTNTIKR